MAKTYSVSGVSGLSKFGDGHQKVKTPPGEATLRTGGCDSRLDREWQRGGGRAGPSRSLGEVAGRERAHGRDRTAEALRSGAIEIDRPQTVARLLAGKWRRP
jgi:hypothetical protein